MTKAIERFFLIGTVVIISGLFVYPSPAQQNKPEKVVDRIVAIVNNDIVLLSDIDKALVPYKMNIMQQHLPEETEKNVLAQARNEILAGLINEKLGRQQAADLGIIVSDQEVTEALDQMKQSMLYSDDAFQSYLSEIGQTVDEYRENVKNQLIKNKLLSHEVKSKIVVTREEVEHYYQDHPEEFATGTWYHLKQIVLLTPKGAEPDQREAVLAKMEEIHQQIKAGASFEDMARQYSQSSVAETGGDLGLFAENDLADTIKEAIINTAEGDITPVIETGFGYQIFYVHSVINNDGNLDDETAGRIHKKLYEKKLDDKFNAWISELRDSAHIKILE